MTVLEQHPPFEEFISTYRRIAASHGLDWDLPVDAEGSIERLTRWDLGELTGTPKPPSYFLSDVGADRPTLKVLNEERLAHGLPAMAGGALSAGWQALLKAMTVRGLFEKRNSAGHLVVGVIRAIRALATCVPGREPWQLSADDLRSALDTIGKLDKNSKLRQLVEAVAITMDDNLLSENSPVLGSRTGAKRVSTKRMSAIRERLEDRRRADRLPGAREFWELLRILLEKNPISFYDMIRFGAVELGVLMGLRVEEMASISVDPVILKRFVDVRGQNPSIRGGIGHTMFLRHFSEKQGLRSSQTVVFAETSTAVLRLFEDEVQAVVDRIQTATAPLRSRLEAQIRTGRIFPEYDPGDVLPLEELFPRLTGNPFAFEGDKNELLAAKYRESFDFDILSEIAEYQRALHRSGANLTRGCNHYMCRPETRWIRRHSSDGPRSGALVAHLEAAIKANIPTKLSDTEGFPLEGGRELSVSDCLFLVPKRALGEGKGQTICDVTRYAFVGRLTQADIAVALGTSASMLKQSFFSKYGSHESAEYTLNSHAIRHMHNNELFAAGVADTIITHRFGRKSVSQSREYDSRSLAQELDDMELPHGTSDLLIGPARDAFKLIASNRGSGKLVTEFRRIQKEEGDEAAIVFLATEADGMQITPYGLCLNSFVVEPCPRHLECFGGCSHLMRTGLPGETAQLQKLADRYRMVLASVDRHPGSESAKAKAKAQATSRLAAIEQTIATKAGERVFPDGADLSRPFKQVRMTGLIE
jgi:hypothetical protein